MRTKQNKEYMRLFSMQPMFHGRIKELTDVDEVEESEKSKRRQRCAELSKRDKTTE